MQWTWCVVFVSLLLGCGATPKNVLILDTIGSPSHQVWMHSLARAVATGDYNVTSLTGKQIKHKPDNLHVYEMHEMYAPVPEEHDINFLDMTGMGPWETMAFFAPFLQASDDVIMNSEAMKVLLNYPKDFKFDLIIYDYLCPPATLALVDQFPGAKLIAASAYPPIEYTDKMTKAPHMYAIASHFYQTEMEDTFFGRLENFLLYAIYDAFNKFVFLPGSEQVVAKSGTKLRRALSEIIDSTQIILTNYNPVMDLVVPIMPTVIPVGGLQIEDPRPLPAELEKIYASAKKGVIFFSLGSNLKSEKLGYAILNEMVRALGQFPEYNIIWKIDLSKLELDLPKNVYIRTWLPQNDILADRRTKLFISHAGGLSTQEATWHGVPVLAIPIMFDQIPNAKKAVKSGMALSLDINNFDSESMKQQMKELLNNKKYSDAAALRSRNFQDQKEKPVERAMWWIDFVMRNDDISFLKSASLAKMNFFTKHSLDVIGFLTIAFVLTLWIFIKLVLCIFRTKASKNKDKAKIS